MLYIIHITSFIKFPIIINGYFSYKNIIIQPLGLPGELAVMQNQALECSLQNVPKELSEADKEFKKLVEGQEILVHVKEVNNDRYINYFL